METRFFFRLIQGVRGKCSGWSAGSSLLWAIGALVVMGVVGAGLALMTPATMQSKLQQEAGMKAYYNANAGLNFIMSMNEVAELNNMSFTNYISLMGGGSSIAYNIDSDEYFTYRLGNIVTNGVNGNYQITNLTGTVANSAGGAAYSYAIYGGGKGSSRILNYVPVGAGGTSTPSGAAKYVFSGGDVTISASKETVVGSIYGRTSISLADNAVITGDLISNGNVSVGSKGSITGSICSDGTVSLTEDNVVTGTINSKSNVTMESRTTTGTITSGGNVTLNGSAQQINGDINAAGNVTIASSANVSGNIVATGSVTVSSSGSKISGNIYAGDVITIKSGITILGGLYSGNNTELQDSSISVGLDINAGKLANFTGWGGTYQKNVYAGTGVNMSGKTTVNGNVESGGAISITGYGSCVKGMAKSKGSITSCTGSSCGSGDCFIGTRLQNQASVTSPISPNSPSSYVACATEPVPNPPKNTKSTNGALSVAKNASKTFSAGTYYSSINVAGGATLKFDLSGGDITIFSTGDINLGNPTTIMVSADGTNYYSMTSVNTDLAKKVYMEANGNITLAWKANWFGTLFSRGTITFQGGNTFIGSYASQSGAAAVTSGSGYSMTYVPSNYAVANW
ncbi:MAG: DUF7305 domain-containing protein [Solidesulfovibrio sp. DCME]|uniref:DUF7305 domain-containing protein n=1 Tax=Solidesulfovibrio sp. DCME TaxID=3447380 RepID=UPI003D129AB8